MNAPLDTVVPRPFVIRHSSFARLNRCSSVSIHGFFLLFATALGVVAQPAPKLTSVSPEWIQRGTTVEVVLAGENLGGVTQILFNGDARSEEHTSELQSPDHLV